MKKQKFMVFNNLFDEKDEYYSKLIEFYNNKKITLEEIINHQTNGLIINAEAVHAFAFWFDTKGEWKTAQSLYLIASGYGSSWAKRSYAYNLIHKKIDKKEDDFQEAIGFLKKAIFEDKNIEQHCLLLLGIAYYNLKKYATAYLYFNNLLSKVNRNSEDYKQANKYLAFYSELSEVVLEQLFELSDKNRLSQAGSSILRNRPEKQRPWYSLTDTFDGFEPDDAGHIILSSRQAVIERNLAGAEVLIIDNQLQDASKKEPKPVIDALQVKTEEYRSLLEIPQKKELRRQVQTEKHFFSPRRTYSVATKELASRIQQNRFSLNPERVEPIEGTNVPGRRMLTADLTALQACLSVYGRRRDYDLLPEWNIDTSKTILQISESGIKYEQYGNTETVKLGEEQLRYRHRVNPHRNHIGDFFMEELPSLESGADIHMNLIALSGGSVDNPNKKNEMIVAGWMIRYAKNGTIVSLAELNSVYLEAKKEDLSQLMRIFFYCLIKQPMSWMMARSESHDLPYAIAQTRAVKLISEGFLTVKDVFSQDAPYGIFTGKNIEKNIGAAVEKINRINRLYEEYMLAQESQNFQPYYLFKRDHANGRLVTSRSQLHHELVDMYGGEEDSDGEGYDSDTAESLYKTVFEFK
jgi:tetratricopeptide (TPR) repeat protein